MILVHFFCVQNIVAQFTHFTLKRGQLPRVILVCYSQRLALISHHIVVFTLIVLQFCGLLFHDLELGIKHELLALNLERLLLQFSDVSIEITLHLSVLRLKQANMLMAGLVIIV